MSIDPATPRELVNSGWYDAIIAELDELAALKARRCDGCVHWSPRSHVLRSPQRGWCTLPSEGRRMYVVGVLELVVDADHACNAWQPREAKP